MFFWSRSSLTMFFRSVAACTCAMSVWSARSATSVDFGSTSRNQVTRASRAMTTNPAIIQSRSA
jgi:hypothetical protein